MRGRTALAIAALAVSLVAPAIVSVRDDAMATGVTPARIFAEPPLTIRCCALDPQWSSDGRRIAYLKSMNPYGRTELPTREITVVGLDGREVRRILTRSAHISNLDWSPAGGMFAFEHWDEARGEAEVVLVRADGRREKVVAVRGAAPAWSPDGQRLAYFSYSTLYVARADGSKRRPVNPYFYAGHPTWSPDGHRLAFARYAQGSATLWQQGIWTVDAAGSSSRRLTSSNGRQLWAQDLDWSPDGRRIVFSSIHDTWLADIYVYDLRARSLRRLTTGATDLSPAWSPDGRRIVFTTDRRSSGEDQDVYVMRADGSGIRRVTHARQ